MVNYKSIGSDGLVKCVAIKIGNTTYSRGMYLPYDKMRLIMLQSVNLRILATITESESIEFDHSCKYITSTYITCNTCITRPIQDNDIHLDPNEQEALRDYFDLRM